MHSVLSLSSDEHLCIFALLSFFFLYKGKKGIPIKHRLNNKIENHQMCDTCFNLNSLWNHKNLKKGKILRDKRISRTQTHTHT